MDRINAVVLCLTPENANQLIITLGSLSKNYGGDIIISHSVDIPDSITDLIDTLDNNVIYFRFLQSAPESGLVVKAMQRAYDTSIHKMLYIAAGCVVSKPIHPITTGDMGNCLFGGTFDYTYRDHPNWRAIYSHEDSKYFDKEEVAGDSYINTDVLLINMSAIRRSNIDIDKLYEKFWNRTYSIKLGLCEFINVLNSKRPFIVLDRLCNAFGDLYLYNGKAYQKSIRGSHIIEHDSIIANFRYCEPWGDSTTLERFTLQYPVPMYNSVVQEYEPYLDFKFVENVSKLSSTYRMLLGDISTSISSYFRGKGKEG